MKNVLWLVTLLSFWSFSNSALAKVDPEVELQELLDVNKGQVIYVDFWASWCKPCRHSFPWMNYMLRKHKSDGFKVITVNLDKERSLADAFLEENPASFKVIFDAKGQLAEKFKLKGMPMSFIISRDGSLVSGHVGFNEEKKIEYENAIEQLLKSSGE
ncbi:TlpA disulfide reductase family protein [Pleionea sediminis]|uniref:TlpA disulfide reductase family protein n=1 Tax=Pleionea sediminis TaxID=2569479 RepID=UPI00197C0CB8|nr:TlpA disulfide reductase family protein [Pleionea sediminis]